MKNLALVFICLIHVLECVRHIIGRNREIIEEFLITVIVAGGGVYCCKNYL